MKEDEGRVEVGFLSSVFSVPCKISVSLYMCLAPCFSLFIFLAPLPIVLVISIECPPNLGFFFGALIY